MKYIAFSLYSLFFFSLLISMNNVNGQEIVPDYYWNFEGNNPEKAVLGESIIKANTLITQKKNGVFGQCLHFNGEAEDWPKMKLNGFANALSIDFWVRFSAESFHRNTRLFWTPKSEITIYFNKNGLNFITSLYQPNGKKESDIFTIGLKGAAENSLGYYLDNQWHHFVFKYDIRSGKKEIWIDGNSPEGFSKRVDFQGKFCPKKDCILPLQFSYQNDGNRNFVGDLDEVRVYHRFIPENVHLSHFQKANLPPRKIEANNSQSNPKAKNGKSQTQVDLHEYPLQHPKVTMTPVGQLRRFPSPRYKSDHNLLPIFNWMGISYLGGAKIGGLTKFDVVKNAIEIQEELAKRWNYMVVIPNVQAAFSDKQLYGKGKMLRETIDLVNRHPEYPLGVISLWGQLTPKAINKPDKKPAVSGKGLSNEYFLQDKKNRFIDRKGEASGGKYLSLAALDDFCDEDGEILEAGLKRIVSELTRPIDMINENGEVPPLPLPTETLLKDPKIVAHKNKLGESDWGIYQAKQKTRFRESFFSRSKKIPQLSSTYFSWYGVDGGPQNLNRFEWVEARKIGSKLNGQYYSTPDFYPRWPENWEKWKGAWRGWEWINISRKKEILAGDKLFSPFVAAGWDKKPEKNVRPSLWFGLLKHLGVVGAEFFYTGFFNVGKGDIEFPDPRNYVWQATMPSYAQAITSRYEDILRNGNVLFDENGSPIIRHNTGDPRILVTVRKHDKSEKYIISGNINPNSNIKGNVEDKGIATISLNGKKLSFEIRRQGSVYYYDATNSQNPIFYQLDTWHQLGHPSRWTKNVLFEAEVFEKSKNINVVTEKLNKADLDFSKFHTYIQSNSRKACAEYDFSLSENQIGKFKVMLKARAMSGKSTGASIYLDNKLIGKIDCIKNRDWEWVDLTQCSKKAVEFTIKNVDPHKLEIRLNDSFIQLEQIKLKAI